MQSAARPAMSADINVTPMIDVLLTVFIIYLLIILLGRQVIPVQLPPPGRGLKARAMPIFVTLPDAGGVLVNGEPVPDGEFETVLREIAASSPASYVLVDPGLNRRYDEVVEVLDRVRGVGISLIGFKAAGPIH